jgi:hypothetical protein
MAAGKTNSRGAVGVLQSKVQVKWDLAEKYMRKALQTTSIPQRMQATQRSQAYANQALALIATLPADLRDTARAADPRKKK